MDLERRVRADPPLREIRGSVNAALGAMSSEFDALYPRLAQKHGVPLYPFFLEGVAQDPVLNQGDGMHPNPKGVEVIVERFMPFAIKNLDNYAASVRRPARP